MFENRSACRESGSNVLHVYKLMLKKISSLAHEIEGIAQFIRYWTTFYGKWDSFNQLYKF